MIVTALSLLDLLTDPHLTLPFYALPLRQHLRPSAGRFLHADRTDSGQRAGDDPAEPRPSIRTRDRRRPGILYTYKSFHIHTSFICDIRTD